MLSVGSIVRVVKQPENQIVKLVGEVSWIEEILGDFATFHSMSIDGTKGGCGSVPLKCLELEPNPAWSEAKRKVDEHKAKMLAESLAFSDHVNAGIKEIAHRHHLTPEEIDQIYIEVRRLYP